MQEVQAFKTAEKAEIESFRIRFNSKKGILTDLFAQFKDVPNDQKKEFGQKINTLKQAVAEKLDALQESTQSNLILEKEDLTRPGFPMELGSRHPINLVKNRIIERITIAFTLNSCSFTLFFASSTFCFVLFSKAL